MVSLTYAMSSSCSCTSVGSIKPGGGLEQGLASN